MGQEAIQNVLEGLKIHSQNVFNKKRLEIEQQQADAQTEAEKARIQIEKDRLDQAKKEFDLSHQIAKKFNDYQIFKAQQEIGQKGAETGVLPPGFQSAPAPPTTLSGAPTIDNLNQANQYSQNNRVITFPSGEQATIPTPTGYATQQADVARITGAPASEFKIAEEKARQAGEVANRLKEIEAEGGQRKLEIAQQGAIQKELTQLRETGENYRARLQRNTQMDIVKFPYTFFMNALGADAKNPQAQINFLQPYVNMLNDGTMSMEDLKSDFAGKQMVGAETGVQALAMKHGIIPLSKAQQQIITNLQPVVDIMSNMDALIKALPQVEGTGKLATAEAYAKGITTLGDANIKSLYQQLESQVANVAKGVSGDQGQRLQKAMLDAAHGGYMPGRTTPTAANAAVRNNFLREVISVYKAVLGSRTEEQKAAIMNRTGILNIPVLDSHGNPLGQGTAAPSGTAAPALSPAALQLMQKYQIPIQ